MRRLSVLFLVTLVSPFVLFCQKQSPSDYDLDSRSPSGTYRVRIVGRSQPRQTGTREYTERVSMQFFKGKEQFYNYESEDSDQYEPTFRETKPMVEWISDSSLRMGEDRSDQRFLDEINVTNETNEKLKYLSVGYGKNELFWIFDLASGASLDLRASPRFKPDGTSNYFVGYGGATWSGRKFEGTMEQTQRKEPSDGPLKFRITITSKDLR